MTISSIHAIEVLDSRGNPTIKTFVELSDGSVGWSMIPSGASTGSHEAVELRDSDSKRYHGLGVLKAINNVNNAIFPYLKDAHSDSIKLIDKKMQSLDSTDLKSKLGANAILSVSIALCRAISISQKKPLWHVLHEQFFDHEIPHFPRLMVNIVNGGKHAEWNFSIQEFIVSPKTNEPKEALQISAEVFHTLGKLLHKNKLSTLKGDEGGYSPKLENNEAVFDMIIESIKQAGYVLHQDIQIGVDVAANEWVNIGKYNPEELHKWYSRLIEDFGLFSFEDPFSEDDWNEFHTFTSTNGNKILVIGDDLYTTNPDRIKKGIEQKATNAVLVKPNQIGTISETAEAINLTKNQGWKVIISHRSGETEDPFIADLAYACNADFLKAGSMSRSERLCKYNRLIEINLSK